MKLITIIESPTGTEVRVMQNTLKGYETMPLGGVCDIAHPTSNTRRGRVQGGGQIAPTLTTQSTLVRVTAEEI